MPFFTRLLLLVLAGASIALARKALDQQRNTQAASNGLGKAARPRTSAAPADAAGAVAPYRLPAPAQLATPYLVAWPCAPNWPGQLPTAKPASSLRPWQL